MIALRAELDCGWRELQSKRKEMRLLTVEDFQLFFFVNNWGISKQLSGLKGHRLALWSSRVDFPFPRSQLNHRTKPELKISFALCHVKHTKLCVRQKFYTESEREFITFRGFFSSFPNWNFKFLSYHPSPKSWSSRKNYDKSERNFSHKNSSSIWKQTRKEALSERKSISFLN